MKHLPKFLPAAILAVVVIVSMCAITLHTPQKPEPVLDQSLAASSTKPTSVSPTSDADTKKTATEPVKTEESAKEEKKEEAKPASSTSILAVGIVNGDVNLRKEANTQSDILTTLTSGTAVSIISDENGWFKVSYDGKQGFMSSEFVTSKSSASDLNGYAKVTTDVLNMRSTPDTSGDIVAAVAEGEYVNLIGFENGWYKVAYSDYEGYMSGDYLSLAAQKPEAPKQSSSSSSSSSSSVPGGQSAGSGSGTGSDIADYALNFLGVPYVYGGTSTGGFDCSGFTMYVYSHFGYGLPHGATSQMNYGTPVGMSELSPGDLVFFLDYDYASSGASHVGIYIGGGQFVHASTSSGSCVKISSFYSDSSTGNYYASVFLTGRHIAG